MDNAAKKKAKKLLLQFGISKLTLDNMLYVIESQGYFQIGGIWFSIKPIKIVSICSSTHFL